MFRFVTNTSRGDVEDQETIDWSTMPFQLLIDEDVFDNENDDDGTKIMKSLTDPLRHSASCHDYDDDCHGDDDDDIYIL